MTDEWAEAMREWAATLSRHAVRERERLEEAIRNAAKRPHDEVLADNVNRIRASRDRALNAALRALDEARAAFRK